MLITCPPNFGYNSCPGVQITPETNGGFPTVEINCGGIPVVLDDWQKLKCAENGLACKYQSGAELTCDTGNCIYNEQSFILSYIDVETLVGGYEIMQRTWILTDPCGNQVSCIQHIKIKLC